MRPHRPITVGQRMAQLRRQAQTMGVHKVALRKFVDRLDAQTEATRIAMEIARLAAETKPEDDDGA